MARLIPFFLFLFCLTSVSAATTHTWDGSASSNWGDAANWNSNAIPTTGDSVILTGAGSAPTNQNIASLSLVNITVDATATTPFTVTGSAVTLTGGTSITINAASANHTFSFPMVLGASTSWSVGAGRILTVTSAVTETGGARTLTKSTAGTLVFDNASLTLTGNVVVNDAGVLTISGTTTFAAATLQVADVGTNCIVNINGTPTLTLTNFWIGETGSLSGTVTQTGGTVTVTNQVRVGHWPTETSTYNISGGSLSVTGTSGTNPFGGTEQNGALYLGIDGTGIFNQTGGAVSAQGLVLDNRGDTGGTDTYTISGGSLTLGQWGIQGNASSSVIFNGGTISASANWACSRPIAFNSTTVVTTFDVTGFTVTFNGALSGAGAITKDGTGTVTIAAASTLTGALVNNAGTISIQSNSAVGSIAGAGQLDLTTGFTLTAGSDNSSTTYSGIISGAGSFTKAGTGTLIVTGANTCSGTFTLNASVLQVGAGGTAGTLGTASTVLGGGTLQFLRSDNITYNGSITGNGTVAQGLANGTTTASILTLGGTASDYTGQTVVNAGTISITQASALGASGPGNETVVNFNTNVGGGTGSMLRLQGGTLSVGETLMLSSNTTGDRRTTFQSNAGTNTWSGPIVVSGTGLVQYNITAGTLNITGPTSGPAFTGTLLIRGNGGTGTISNTITMGTATFTRTDAALWILAANGNTWGNSNISTGELRLGINDALPATSVLSLGQNSGTDFATFNLNGFNQTIAGLGENVRTSATIAPRTVTSATPATLTINDNTNRSFGPTAADRTRGIITGAVSLVKGGTGTYTLTADNTYSGTTTITTGTLQIGNNTTTGALGTGTVTNNAALIFNRSNDHSVTNDIAGTGTLAQSGSGVLTLSGTSSYSGNTTVAMGTLVAASNTALGSAVGITTVTDVARLGFSGGVTVPENITIDNTAQLFNLDSDNSLTGTVNLNTGFVDYARLDIGPDLQRIETGYTGIGTAANNANGSNLAVTSFNSLTGDPLTIAINNTDQNNTNVGGVDWRDRGDATTPPTLGILTEDLIKNNNGVLRLTLTGLPANNYKIFGYHVDTLGTQSDNIQLYINTGGGFVLAADTGSAGINYGGVNGANFTNANILASTSNGSFTADGINNVIIVYDGRPSADDETPLNGITLLYPSTAPATLNIVAGSLSLNGVIDDGVSSIGFNKTGTGLLRLSGANTFDGGVNIQQGTLDIANTTGSATGSGNVSVAAGASISGTGTAAGNLMLDGTIDPGTSGTGTLSIGGNVTFNSGSTFNATLSGTTTNSLSVAGGVTIDPAAELQFTATGSVQNDTYTLINKTGAGAITGTFNTLAESATRIVNNRPYVVTYVGGTGNDCQLRDDGPEFTNATTNTVQNLDEGGSLAAVVATVSGARPLTYSLQSGSLPSGVTALNTDGTFSGATDANSVGNYTLGIRVTDDRGTYDETTLSITVTDAGFSVADVSVNETAGTVTITVTRTGNGIGAASVQAGTFNDTALAGTDYTTTSTTLNWGTGVTGNMTFTVPILDDLISEGPEMFIVNLSNATTTLIDDGSATVTIVDDEPLPMLSVSDVSVPESIGNASVIVTLSGPSAQPVSVDLVASNGTATDGLDFAAGTATLTWNPGESGARTASFAIVSDLIDEPDETVTLTLANATASAAIADGSGVLTILDDDSPPAAVADAFNVGFNTLRVLNVLANDGGLANTPLTVTIVVAPANGIAAVNADNSVSYTPATGFLGADSFTYRFADSVGQFSDAVVSITVVPAPVFTSTPVVTPNPTFAGQPVLGTAPADVGTVMWSWGDGSSNSSAQHTYASPGVYNVIATATSPEGAVTTFALSVFVGIGLDGTAGGGTGGGATPPGVTGILVGGSGAGAAQGGSGKVTCNYVRRDKTTYQGSIAKLALPATLTQEALTAQVSTLTIGTGANAAVFRFDLNARGRGKATGLPLVEFNVKKKRFKFKAQRADLTDLTEALGGPREFAKISQPVTMLVPVTVQIGNSVYLALTFQVRYKQINNGGKGAL